MADIEKYLQDLRSSNKNKRLDACNNLRRMKTIPESAFLALQEAINDPDKLVADEAGKALLAHPAPDPNFSIELGSANSKEHSFLAIASLFLIIASCVIFGRPIKSIPGDEGFGIVGNVIPAALLFIFGVIFLLIALSWRKTDKLASDDNKKSDEDAKKP